MKTLQEIISQSKVEPRDYQASIIEKTYSGFVNDSLKSIMIELPTGAGKTVIGLVTCKLLQENLGLKIGWVAHRRFLLRQAQEENHEKKINADIKFISMFDKNPPTDLDMLVIDEAVHDAAASCAHLHNVIKPRFILGLSAFPLRSDRVKLCFDKTIKEAGIASLIEKGYLSKYYHWTIGNEYNPETVFKFYYDRWQKWGKTIAYFHTIIQCQEFQELCLSKNIGCEVVTGASDKYRQLREFKRNPAIPVIANCMMLTEGFNMRTLKTVFLRPSCRGLTVQMAGRVLRKHPKVTIKNVVQCAKTKYPFIKTALPEKQLIWSGDEWRSLTPNNNAEVAHSNLIKSIATITVTMPQFITSQKKAPPRRRNTGPSED